MNAASIFVRSFFFTAHFISATIALIGVLSPMVEAASIDVDYGALHGINYTPRYESWTPESFAPEKYRPQAVRRELDIVKQMGFNSVRLLPRVMYAPYFDKVLDDLDGNGDVTEDFLKACRERKMKAIVSLYSIPPFDKEPSWNPDFAAGEFADRIRRYVKYFVDRFDEPYADVIAAWELVNEPDVNPLGRPYDQVAAQYASDVNWPVRRSALKRLAELTRELGAKRPLTIGYMTAPLYDKKSIEFLDVVNYHSYPCLMRDFEKEYSLVKSNAGEKPIVITELAHNGGTHQAASDPIRFCAKNRVGFFLWEFKNDGYWGDTQGIVNADDTLRVAGLPFGIVQRYPHFRLFTTIAFDRTPAGKGNIDASWAGQAGAIENAKNDPAEAYKMLEYSYNVARAVVPYWTADFKDAYPPFTKATPIALRVKPFLDCYDAMRPYVRTTESAGADDKLGGRRQIRYLEESDPNPVHARLRYARNRGKDGSAAVMAVTPKRVVAQGFQADPKKSYRFEADVRPAPFAPVALLIAAEASFDRNRPAVRITVGAKPGEEKLLKDRSLPETGLLAENVVVAEQVVRAPLEENDYASDGFVHLVVEFHGLGSAADPTCAVVSVAGKERLVAKFETHADSAFCVGFESLGCGTPTYFDNLKLTNITDDLVEFSDSFENGAVDFDYLNYEGEKNRVVLENFDRMEKLIAAQVRLQPRKLQEPTEAKIVGQKEGIVDLEWKDSSNRESGFIVEVKDASGKWNEIWRTWPNQTRSRVPLADESLTAGPFRVRPFASDNR